MTRAAACAALIAICGQASAQDGDAITLIVPYDPAGPTDIMVRAIADLMEEELGSSVIVANSSGGGGIVGMEQALASAPDGKTAGLYLTNTLVGMATGAAPFGMEDIAPACMFAETPLAVAGIGGEEALSGLEDLLATEDARLAIERGTLSQLAGLLMEDASGHQFQLIAVEAGPDKVMSVLDGLVTAVVTPLPGVIREHETGEFRILGVLSDERLERMPDLPTAREQGVDLSMIQSFGFMFPAGTPEPDIDAFCDTVETATQDADFRALMDALGVDLRFLRGVNYGEYMREQRERIADLAAIAGFGG
ncbi:tripartite tricarboxylate transporter substrate binding protein [Palleronia sp. LCG004]|uniref:tripartite tricarboxylate transporter substrate binding protein n=1 Tax=Palleronia sp. LCG004 TaxID=3079304 RepID=UPI002941CA1E|nr:tripartite tricarboxylate transporter substrate binding protein [Palleronia sp. LCG004]WOI57717.1 tripartite tricarboxylate transporter substrate binding protein [Palleronia sp. LCG004]